MWILPALLVALATGCCDDGPIDGGAHMGAFKDLPAYKVFKGTVKIEVQASAASRLELLAGGKPVGSLTAPPHSFTWDTTKTPDGLVKLSLRQQDGQVPSVLDEVQVVVLNKGAEASYHKGASSGTLAVPQAGGKNPHLSFTWTMPDDGVREVLALLFWKDSSFHMELSMGVGCCANSGTTGAKKRADPAPVVVTFEDTKELPLPVSTKWFVDASATNPGEVAGKKTELFVKVYLLK